MVSEVQKEKLNYKGYKKKYESIALVMEELGISQENGLRTETGRSRWIST